MLTRQSLARSLCAGVSEAGLDCCRVLTARARIEMPRIAQPRLTSTAVRM